jgi:hypothetical protein
MTKLLSALIVSALSVLLVNLGQSAATTGVGYASPNDPALKHVPTTLSWSASAQKAASDGQRYFESMLLREIRLQKSKGSVKLRKIYSTVSPEYAGTDWRSYLPEVRDYRIRGFDSENRLVRTSDPFPAPTSLMAAKLVYLQQDECSLREFNLFNIATWWQKVCSIKIHPKEQFLRASLRSWLRMTDDPISFARFPQQQLDICFEMKSKFTVTGKTLTCPELSKYFNSITSVKLYFLDPQGGYEIVVDKKTKTYKTKYFAPDFQKLSTYASWNDQLATITFSSATN